MKDIFIHILYLACESPSVPCKHRVLLNSNYCANMLCQHVYKFNFSAVRERRHVIIAWGTEQQLYLISLVYTVLVADKALLVGVDRQQFYVVFSNYVTQTLLFSII